MEGLVLPLFLLPGATAPGEERGGGRWQTSVA